MNSLNSSHTESEGHDKSPLWRLTLAGKLRADGPQGSEIRFQLGKTATLLGYLTYFCHEMHSREMLADRFWPTSPPLEARHCLRQALTFLRHQLEPGDTPPGSVVRSTRHFVQINPDAVITDVSEFRDRVERAVKMTDRKQRSALLLQAVEEYNGQFLPGQFEEWVLVERERVISEYTHALGRLAADLTVLGDTDLAISYAQRATEAMPLNELAHRDVLRLLACAGRAQEAMQHYDRLKRYLKRELGSKPQPVTRSLARSINTQRDLPDSASLFLSLFSGTTEEVAHSDQPYTPRRRRKSKSWTKAFPIRQTRFFGRETEMTALLDLLASGLEAHRPVSITGPGGIGKSRLVEEAMPKLQEIFHDRIFYTALGTVTRATDLMPVLRDHLPLVDGDAGSLLTQIAAALSKQHALLILDHCDALMLEVKEFIVLLQKEAPKLIVLTTSRLPLELEKECELALSPLTVPQGPGRPLRLMESSSIQLFVERAQAVCPEFQITLRNAPSIFTVCARLEGIPLAVELVAARTRAFAPPQMLTSLNDRFDFLLRRHPHADLRSRTLRAVIEWGYEQMPAALQYLFNAISVFPGSWTLDAAQGVCAVPGSGHGEPKGGTEPGEVFLLATQVLDLMEQLQERALLFVASDEGETRFRMLETLRKFGQEQLAPSLNKKLSESFAAYYLRVAEQGQAHLFGAEQDHWKELLTLEMHNFRAALHSTLSPTLRLSLSGSLWRMWQLRGEYREGAKWLKRGLEEAPRADAGLRARAQLGLGVLLHLQDNDRDARTALESSSALYRHIGDTQGLTRALHSLEVVAGSLGDAEAAIEYATQSARLWDGGEMSALDYILLNREAQEAPVYAAVETKVASSFVKA